MVRKLYEIFNCIVRDDGKNTLHSRTIYLIQGFLTQVYFSLSEVLVGLFNLKSNNFITYAILALFCVGCAYISVSALNEEIGNKIIEKNLELNKKKRLQYVFLSILLFLGAFIMLIACGILMSYLFSI